MGYQGGRRYGDDRYATGWDRGDRYRGQREGRGDERGYRYGTRGQFGGPDYRRTPEDYDPEERGFFDRAGDEIKSWFGDDEAPQHTFDLSLEEQDGVLIVTASRAPGYDGEDRSPELLSELFDYLY